MNINQVSSGDICKWNFKKFIECEYEMLELLLLNGFENLLMAGGNKTQTSKLKENL